MGNLFAMIQKELRHLSRDKQTVGLVTFLPLVQLLLFGFAIDTDVKHLHTVVQDEDHTSLSRRLVAAFEQSAYFDVHEWVHTPQQLRHALDRGGAKAGLHIPPHFARDAYAGRPAAVQLVIDGTDSTPANAALNTSQAIVSAFLDREGLTPARVQAIDFRPRLWYNPDLKSTFFFIPGLVGFLTMLLIPLLTSTTVVREKENGTIEQLLVTPIKPWQIMIGKIVPYLGIGVIIAATILAGARVIFQVPIRGHVVTLFVLTVLYLTVYLGFGLLASTIAATQQQASQIIIGLVGPSVLISGFIFPRETMPKAIYWMGNLIPLTHYLIIIRGVVLKGLGFGDLQPQIIALMVMAVVIMTISIRKFHKRLA